MKSSYKRLGDYIRVVDIRNSGLKVQKLLGLSISKEFIPSVANIIGTDMENYKILSYGQFACSTMQVRRDKKIPIALYLENEDAIISQAYTIFEVIDQEELLPAYLMMWFSRSEFDREACFHAVGGVRGSLEWDDFCDFRLPIPSIEKQREIVAEYKVIEDRIVLNNQMIQKLEDTAQAIYKQWFVDFEFPNEEGKPYKSSGGEMVWCEELGKEIPLGWELGSLGCLIDVINGYAFSSDDFDIEGNFPIIKISNIISPNIDLTSAQYFSAKIDTRLKNCIVNQDDILISMTGSHMNQINSAVGKIGRYNYDFSALLNQRVGKIKSKMRCNEFIFITMFQPDVQTEILMSATGSANQANISPSTIKNIELIVPDKTVLGFFEDVILKPRRCNSNSSKENQKLMKLKELLLSKLASGV